MARPAWVWVASLFFACSEGAPVPAREASCGTLFGRPNAKTGLDATQCQPRCACGGAVFEPPDYDEAFVAALSTAWVLDKPYPNVDADPYASPPPDADAPDTVCAVVPGVAGAVGPRPYTLVTYVSEAEAHDAGAFVTHFGACGVCSPLTNLAVYIREPDLTGPVRECGLTSKTLEAHVACLRALGFDEPCAQIWYWNTLNTRSACLGACLAALNAPYHDETGALNECLACDERESGPIFKAVAGRTRRNSGLPNAMCRPCSEVRPLVHAYPSD